MKQTILLILKKDKKIEQIRKRSNIDTRKFKPHISLVYPFELLDQKRLFEHINCVIKEFNSFDVELTKLDKSRKEYYLYLSPVKGKKIILNLYKKLNRGILWGFKNKDMPKYIPHISLGIFKTRKEIDNAIKELRKEKLKYKAKIDSIQLLTLNKDNSINKIKNFKLK